jgi:hypothetical protein
MHSVRQSCSRPPDDKAGPRRARVRQGDGQTRMQPPLDACAVQVEQLRAVDTDTGDCGQPPGSASAR